MDVNKRWAEFNRSHSDTINPYLSSTRPSAHRQDSNGFAESSDAYNKCNHKESTIVCPARSHDDLNQQITDLYISTQTKSMFMDIEINIRNLFDAIQVFSYVEPREGVIKKQIILETQTATDAVQLHQTLLDSKAVTSHPFNIKLPAAFSISPLPEEHKYKFHVSIGFSRKNFKKASLQAFSHCVALTIRILFNGEYKDTHVKIFNTGKIEIPGKFTMAFICQLQEFITHMLWDRIGMKPTRYVDEPIAFANSNFGVPFVIQLETFHKILIQEYKLNVIFDICKFHGLKCLFKYNRLKPMEEQTGCVDEEDAHLSNKKIKEMKDKYMTVHFICYKTGKCLIAGKCSEVVLCGIYAFFKNVFIKEYERIYESEREMTDKPVSGKKRAKKVMVTLDYLEQLTK